MRAGRVVEPLVLEIAKSCVQPGTVVLEVGAYYGQMTFLCAELVGKGGMIFAFEADEYRFAILQKNARANPPREHPGYTRRGSKPGSRSFFSRAGSRSFS